MVMFPPQPAEPVSAGFNEETGDPVEITVSWMIIKKDLTNSLRVMSLAVVLTQTR